MLDANWWNQWQLLAWLAPAAWGACALIDVVLVDRRVFRNPDEAAALSGGLTVLPFLLLASPYADPTALDAITAALAAVAGLAFVLHLLCYFRALFTANDAAHAESFMNLDVMVVPLLAFVFLGEQLSDAHYLGIALASAGVLVLNAGARRHLYASRGVTALLLAAVLFMSASLVIQDWVFARTDYWSALAWFSLGALGGALMLSARPDCRGAWRTLVRHKGALVLTQLLSAVAIMASLRATDLSPSASLVAAIGCTVPVLVMLLSAVALALLRAMPARVRIPPRRCHAGAPRATLRHALRRQLQAGPSKVAATAFILGGVYLISAA